MATLDARNQRFRRKSFIPAPTGFALSREWSTTFEMRSPRYTTPLEDIPVVAA